MRVVQGEGAEGAATNGTTLITLLIIELNDWIINVRKWMKSFNRPEYESTAKKKWESWVCNCSKQMTHLREPLLKNLPPDTEGDHVTWHGQK